MSTLLAFAISVSIAVLCLGTFYRLWRLTRSPITRHIAITPTPTTRFGIFIALLIETVVFRTLWRASFWTWIFSWLFHLCLLLTILIHARFLSIPAPKISAWLMPYTTFVSWGLVIGLLGLLARRLLVDRVRFVSSPSDFLHLLLILTIAGLGMMLSASHSVNVYEMTLFVQGLFNGAWQPLASNFVLLMHVLGACVLLCLYPFSKLFHGPLMWFNPTRSRPEPPRS